MAALMKYDAIYAASYRKLAGMQTNPGKRLTLISAGARPGPDATVARPPRRRRPVTAFDYVLKLVAGAGPYW